LVILDLTYDPFCDVPLCRYIKDFYRENVIICLSFSKAFGLAGALLGVLIADPCLISTLSAYQENFVFDYFQWAIGHTLFQEKWLTFTQRKILQTQQLRTTLYDALCKAHFCESVFLANANFICICLRDSSLIQSFIKGAACKWFPNERLLRLTVNAKTQDFLAAHRAQEMI
jgi:histidinol-phosphate/aromatic aminotransferase/cobyric acid decarboxylase-like protein